MPQTFYYSSIFFYFLSMFKSAGPQGSLAPLTCAWAVLNPLWCPLEKQGGQQRPHLVWVWGPETAEASVWVGEQLPLRLHNSKADPLPSPRLSFGTLRWNLSKARSCGSLGAVREAGCWTAVSMTAQQGKHTDLQQHIPGVTPAFQFSSWCFLCGSKWKSCFCVSPHSRSQEVIPVQLLQHQDSAAGTGHSSQALACDIWSPSPLHSALNYFLPAMNHTGEGSFQ